MKLKGRQIQCFPPADDSRRLVAGDISFMSLNNTVYKT